MIVKIYSNDGKKLIEAELDTLHEYSGIVQALINAQELVRKLKQDCSKPLHNGCYPCT